MPSVFSCLERQNNQRLWQPGKSRKYLRIVWWDSKPTFRWLKKQKTILQDAASSHRKLYLKGRHSTKCLELYKVLFKNFLAARSRGHRVQPESSNWTLIWKLKLNIMIMWAFCSKKSWKWDQNKEAQERNGKITEGMACNVQRKVHSDRIGRL